MGCQRALQVFVLGQGGGALPAQRQQPHQLAVAAIAQRLQLNVAAGQLDRTPVLPAPLIELDQPLQGAEHKLPQALPHQQGPLLEDLAVAHEEKSQEVAPVERRSAALHFRAGRAQTPGTVVVRFGARDQLRELPDIHLPGGLGVHLDRLHAGDQKRLTGAFLSQHPAQLGESLAEVLARRVLRQVGPQQGAQAGSRVHPAGFDAQISEQGAHFVVFKAAQKLAVEPDLQRTEQGDR